MNIINTSIEKSNLLQACCRISCISDLTGREAAAIRNEISSCLASGEYNTIYLDTRDVNNADLSGINEVIHTAYTLDNTNSQFILIYKSGSVVEKWIQTTGLDKFIQTAIIPVT